MSLTLHQLRTDGRHFLGWLIVLWGLCVAQTLMLPLSPANGRLLVLLHGLLGMAQIVVGAALVVLSVHSTRMAGSDAFWMTRPLGRRAVFRSRTLFLVVFMLLPLTCSYAIAWCALRASPADIVAGLAEVLLVAGALMGVLAAVAGLTEDALQFFRRGAMLVAIALVGGLAFRHLLLPTVGRQGLLAPRAPGSTAVVVLFFLLVCALGSWIGHGRYRRRRLATGLLWLAAVGAVPVGALCRIPPRPPSLEPGHEVAARLLQDEPVPSPVPAGTQLLWSHMLAEDLPEHYVVGATDLQGSLVLDTATGDRTLRAHSPGIGHFDHPLLSFHHEEDYFRAIRGFFPDDTLWFGWHVVQHRHLPLEFPALHGPIQGRFECRLDLNLYEVVRLAVLPLQRASAYLAPGHRFTISRIGWEEEKVRLAVVEERIPERFGESGAHGPPRLRSRARIYVVYHEPTGEAHAVEDQSHHANTEATTFTVRVLESSLDIPVPALRTYLTGVSLDRWLEESRLHVFEPRLRGRQRVRLAADDYLFSPGAPPSPGRESPRAGPPATAELPPQPTEEQIGEYLDTVLAQLPEQWQRGDVERIRAQLTVIGSAGVPAFLDRLPLGDRYHRVLVRPVLGKLAKREHIPALGEALLRGVRLEWLFVQKKWLDEGAELIARVLPQRRFPLPPEALILAAHGRDPALYDDMVWHFGHMTAYHVRALPHLEVCPGFPMAEALSLVWRRLRIDRASDPGIAAAVALLGRDDALDSAIAQLAARQSEKRREFVLERLRTAVAYDGPSDGLAAWLTENRGRFSYDPEAKRFRVAPEGG